MNAITIANCNSKCNRIIEKQNQSIRSVFCIILAPTKIQMKEKNSSRFHKPTKFLLMQRNVKFMTMAVRLQLKKVVAVEMDSPVPWTFSTCSSAAVSHLAGTKYRSSFQSDMDYNFLFPNKIWINC